MNVAFRRYLAAGLMITVLGLVVGPTKARADIVFFGDTGGTNNVASGYGMGPSGGINNAISQGFTMTGTYNLTSVNLYLDQYQPAAGSSMALSIYSNSGGQPGTDLFDLPTSNIASAVGGSPVLVTFTGTSTYPLTSGSTYWLNFYATNPSNPTGTTVEWNLALDSGFGQVNPSGPGATDLGQLRSIGAGNPPTGTPSTSDLRTAFALNGAAAVPEPTSLTLVGIGGVGALICAYRRRKAGIR